jgi:hypothetical protein
MSMSNFTPELWAATLLRNLHKKYVFAQPGVINRDYEGQIKEKGDTVRITSIGAVAVGDYVKDTDMTAAQALTDAQTALVIEKAKFFNFAVDDIDTAQAAGNIMDEAMFESGQALGNAMDTYLAGFYTDVDSANFVGTDGSPKTLTLATDAYPLLTQVKVKLDEANVPEEGRFIIVPAWFEGVMLQDDRFIRQFNNIAPEALLNGMIAKAAGFNILLSNNVTFNGTAATGQYRMLAGYPGAWTVAEQINEVEGYRPQLRFADAVKGLQLYGAKVTKPSALSVLTVTRNLA